MKLAVAKEQVTVAGAAGLTEEQVILVVVGAGDLGAAERVVDGEGGPVVEGHAPSTPHPPRHSRVRLSLTLLAASISPFLHSNATSHKWSFGGTLLCGFRLIFSEYNLHYCCIVSYFLGRVVGQCGG